jgi:hypothetical protein
MKENNRENKKRISINKNDRIFYFLECESEKAVVNAIKNKYIFSGQTYTLNITKCRPNKLKARIRGIPVNSVCVVVFDSDVFEENKSGSKKITLENIKIIKDNGNLKYLLIICQINNLEDELINSTQIKKITELLNSKSDGDVKTDIISCSNLLKKMEDAKFNIELFWSGKNPEFLKIENESFYIKLNGLHK